MTENAPTNGTPKKAGRHTAQHKCTEVRKAAFLECLEKGTGRVKAAKAVGVSYTTFLKEMRADATFRDAVDFAEMTVNQIVEDSLLAQAKKGHVAACFGWLYNRSPERWQDRRNVSIDATMNYRNPLEGKTIEELDRIADFAERASPEDLEFLRRATEGLADGAGDGPGGNGDNPTSK